MPDDLALASEDGGSGGAGAIHLVNARGGLQLRSGPGTQFPALRLLPFGTSLHVLKREGEWALVDLHGDGAADGHVHFSYLRAPSVAVAPAGGFLSLDRTILQTIMDRCAKIHVRSPLNLDQVSDALNRAMVLADAGTRLREVAFLSQAVIETDYFKTFREYGGGAGKAYGRFFGRGMHQLTWEDTYRQCSMAVFGDNRLVTNPDLILNDIEINIKATAWYWRDHKPFNRLADAEDIDEIIHLLYGGRITSPKEAVRRSVILRRSFYVTIKAVLNEFSVRR